MRFPFSIFFLIFSVFIFIFVSLSFVVAVNKNLLYVATPTDVQSSDEEYVDCRPILKNDLTGVEVNKEIDNVSKILDETIQILEEHYPKLGESKNANFTVTNEKLNEGFIDVTNSLTDQSSETSKYNNSQSHDKDLEIETSTSFAQLSDGIETVDPTEVSADLTSQCTSEQLLCDQETKLREVIDDPVVNPCNELNKSENITSSVIQVVDNKLETTHPKEQDNSDVDVELNQTNTLFNKDESSTSHPVTILTNYESNSTVVLESNPATSGEGTEIHTTEPESTEVKQVEKIVQFRSHQTVSVDSLESDSETRHCSLDSLEMKQPTKREPSTPIDQCLSAATADEFFSRKNSPALSEMFPNCDQSIDELNNCVGKLSLQDTCSVSLPVVSKNDETTELLNEKSSNNLSVSTERLIRRQTFNLPVASSDNTTSSMEELPNVDFPPICESRQSIGRLSRQNAYSYSPPVVANENETPFVEAVESNQLDFKSPSLPISSSGRMNQEQFVDRSNCDFSEFSLFLLFISIFFSFIYFKFIYSGSVGKFYLSLYTFQFLFTNLS